MTSSGDEPLVLQDRASDALFRAVRTGNAFEETVERLLQAIRLGVVAPGERLPAERELATRLKVSRVTLREAIRALQEAGYVESRRGRYGGTFVNVEPPRSTRKGPRRIAREMGVDLHDALTHRHVLETGAAEMAAARDLGEAERAHLVSLLSNAGNAELQNYRRMDSRLHLAIAELTGSASLTSAVADVRMRLNELLDAIPLLERNIVHSNEQHEEVVRAILDGDPDAARRSMAEHLDGTASLLRGFLS
ncbi:FadR/GntR family transcriptional regulator [Saccharopolyspora rosea]|uniref:FadR/GntR family transcriptional regulator n=1 Tax=Saccharopolyspora rosea TaxID=524884 RepID=A0ABW3G0R0_9PSEU|nr:GntR family transcriptional regulator [Saccharopolyspora rosea]